MQPTNPPSQPTLRLRVTAAAESAVRDGHPWVYGDSVRGQNRTGKTGEMGIIYDRKDRFLAIGFFDNESPIRVRILHVGKPVKIDAYWWQAQLDRTLPRRVGRFDDNTNGYRVIHGESDGWPGLVLDRYADVLVLKLYTTAWFPLLNSLAKWIGDRLHPQTIVLRLSRNIQAAAATQNLRDGLLLTGAPVTGPIVFKENGLRFEADVLRGQKTGFFLDQRENRHIVGELAKDCDVLNAFSFSGGFSLYAARGGAKSVSDLDISEHALRSAGENFSLNQADANVAKCRHEAIQADAFEWLAGHPQQKFNLIVLDPPSLAKREAERAGAIRAYQSLSKSAISHLNKGGVLVACSCSAHVTTAEFFQAVTSAAKESGRAWKELQTTGHPPDHPAMFREAQYLKGIYLRFD